MNAILAQDTITHTNPNDAQQAPNAIELIHVDALDAIAGGDVLVSFG